MRKLLLVFLLLFSAQSFAGVIVSGTMTIARSEVPKELQNFSGDTYLMKYQCSNAERKLLDLYSRGDSIINLKALIDSGIVTGYRVFQLNYALKGCPITKIYELNNTFQIEYTISKSASKEFDLVEASSLVPGGPFRSYVNGRLCRTSDFAWIDDYEIYTPGELEKSQAGKLWVLSIGINDYGDLKFMNCISDAESYTAFFRKSFLARLPGDIDAGLVNAFTLTEKSATRDSILAVLKHISKNASPKDYFIFNFAGFSIEPKAEYGTSQTHFAAYGWEGFPNKTIKDHSNLISLSELKEYLEYMPARNQLFITESGPTDRFRQEFISTLINKNLELEDLLNKNRVIIVPNGMGMDGGTCEPKKGPLNYYITSIDTPYNIFSLFDKGSYGSSSITHQLYDKHFKCPVDENKEYFSVFFEREFMNLVGSLSAGGMQMRSNRNGQQGTNTNSPGYGKKYALVIGTGNYKSKDEWKTLPNAILDAKAIAAELENNYGYTVETLVDPPMNKIYEQLWSYSKTLGSTDQFLLYIAGHGDYDSIFLDDGVIVCNDSKLSSDDRSRDSYIPYSKLERILSKMPTNHLLLMLDVCFGGTFDSRVATNRDKGDATYTGLNKSEIISEKAGLRTRRFISSGSKVPVPDGYPGLHSPFAYFVLEILRGKGGSKGFFTSTQLYARLQETLKSKPLSEGFGSNQPGSDYVFEYVPRK